MKAICFCTRRSFHGFHKNIYENQCDLRNAAKCSEFTIIKATLPSKTLRCQLRMHWRHWQPALGHWASELLWGLQGTPTKARRIWNGGLKWTELWNEMKWVCPTWLWCYMMLYDAIWCYIMLYESIRTPPLVLVGRQTRWTWTSSAKKKQTQNSLQRFFSRKIQSNIYNDIIVFVFFPFRVAWLHQSTNLAISRKTLEERFHLSFSEFRMSWDSQGLQNSYGSVKGMAFQRLRASWSTPEWVHCGPPCKQSMCAWCWMDLDGWPFWSFL